jgi:hypothetical protein
MPKYFVASIRMILQRFWLAVVCPKIRHVDFGPPIRFNDRGPDFKAKKMKKLVLCMILVATPAWSQTKPAPKAAERTDVCAPIGQTARRELVYSIKCGNVPVPPPPPQAEVQPSPPPEPQRGGIFGWSLDRR